MSALHLYNSLSRQKEPFHPITPNHVMMYVCGMTVYDFCHIGHARVMVVFDTIARHLRASGYQLTYVRNITDIDDKIIRRAAENNEPIQALTQRFINAMHEDEAALGCLPPSIEPKATEYVAEMIAMIGELIAQNHAYIADNGDVYYAVRSFDEYGKLANRRLEDLRAGERIAINEAKNDPLDFVLWKKAKTGEPSWESPWGAGRPGWHIECSVMSRHQLGDHFDIHGGGMDLKFPHHECEIAQSEPICGGKHVNYWLHNGFINIDNEKMSKSLGNFFTVRDVLKNYAGEVIRFFMLQSHYRGPVNYSDAALEEAKRGLQRLYTALETAPTTGGAILLPYQEKFVAAMDDDFNTPQAIAVLFELAKMLNKAAAAEAADIALTLRTLAARLGLLTGDAKTLFQQKGALSAAEIEAEIARRQAAKAAKDYATADTIREKLSALGIELKDSATGTQWYYR